MQLNTEKAKSFQFSKQMFIDAIAALFVLLFLYTATSKLAEYDKSLLQMSKSPIITDYAYFLVWLVPTIEIIIAILLMLPKTIMAGLYAAFTMMTLFTVYIIAILNFSDSIPCSCGGVLAAMDWNQHLIFNIVFIILAITGIILQAKVDEDKKRKDNSLYI